MAYKSPLSRFLAEGLDCDKMKRLAWKSKGKFIVDINDIKDEQERAELVLIGYSIYSDPIDILGKSWHEHGLLVVDIGDTRLKDKERKKIISIGNRAYGMLENN